MTQPATPASDQANSIITQWVQRHGAVQGQPYATNPTITNTGPDATVNPTVVNPNPVYRYTFADGSTLDMDGSGAIKASSEKGATASSSTAPTTRQGPDGNTYQWDASSNQWVLAPGIPQGGKAASAPTTVSAPSNEAYVLLRDPQTGQITATNNPNYVPPADGTKTVAVGSKVYEKQPDGSYKVVIDSDAGPKVIGGTSSSDQYLLLQDAGGHTSQIPNPNYVAPRPQVISGGQTTDQYIVKQNPDGTTSKEPNPNYQPPKPSVVSTNTDSPVITTIDANGTLSSQPNPGYSPKPLSNDTVAPYLLIPVPDGKGGVTLQQTPNPNQQTVNDSILGMYSSLSPLVTGGQIPLDTAKELLTAAATRYTQDLTARGQDVTAQGQALNYANSVASDAARMAQDANNYAVAPGTSAYVHSQQTGGSAPAPGPLRQLPYDPATFAANTAAAALAHISPAAFAHHQAVVSGQQPPAAQPQVPFQAPSPADNTGSGAAGPNPQTPGQVAATTQIAPDGTVTIQHTPAPNPSVPFMAPGWEYNQSAPTDTPAPDPLHPPVISQSGSRFTPFQAPQAA